MIVLCNYTNHNTMISYKVLIALTVTYITCCSSSTDTDITDKDRCYDCYEKLYGVGFSHHSGLINYCFTQQFLFKTDVNEEHENKPLNHANEEHESKTLDREFLQLLL
ncbi:uncharacterized protein LOC107882712 [Acyrthosiphon pisum]|uniref:Uncharacterized protein n=1 Tax=Acyrthosiphon pisum TaxID=7029 RepID=A0A8R2NLE0_ACYPI|nr:uncharacterized protein LOC107882712 [Acyrthosiphon pisum]